MRWRVVVVCAGTLCIGATILSLLAADSPRSASKAAVVRRSAVPAERVVPPASSPIVVAPASSPIVVAPASSPIVLQAGAGAKEAVRCNIPCFWVGAPSLVMTGHVAGTNLTFVLSMEGPGHFASLRRRTYAIRATGDMLSDVPCPWLNNLSDIYVEGVDHATAQSKASFIANNCRSLNKRETWVKDLQAHYPVASLGRCLHNTNRPFKQTTRDWKADKIQLMRGFLFHLAFENQNEDHMTEKLYFALQAGTVPVYMGDRRARRWAPRHSFIDAHEFANGRELGAYLQHVAANATLYNSYHAWRSQPRDPHLVRFFEPMERYHVKCRICQRAAAMLARRAR